MIAVNRQRAYNNVVTISTTIKRSYMKHSTIFFTVLAISLIATSAVFAQDLTGTMQKLSQDAAQAYVSPIVSGFGADLNGGWFHKAPRSVKLGFDLEIGAVAMGTFFKDENKVFATSGNFQFDFDQSLMMAQSAGAPSVGGADTALAVLITQQTFPVTISGPTVIGNKTDNVTIHVAGQTVSGYNIPAQDMALAVTGLIENATIVPFGAPQVTIGTVFGTQASFRYLPDVEISSDIGSFKYFGFGIQHNPAVWFGSSFPVDLSLGYFTQKMDIGSILSTSTTAFGIQVSKQLGYTYLNITPYAGYQSESSTMTFTYDYTINTLAGPSTQHVTFDLTGANTSRFTVGLGVRLLIFNLNADYNFGTYNSATAGFMFSF